jgi:HK97 gp10 family phage protein
MPHSLAQFAGDLGLIIAGTEVFHREVMEKACMIVETEAKRVIGTYDYGWPSLAESTMQDRIAHGFAANEPLLRTGEMRDSIEHQVESDALVTRGVVGSNNEIVKYQELGTEHIPPRSFLGEAAMHKEEEVHELFGAGMLSHILLHLKP